MDKAAETQVFIRTLLTNPSKRGAINDIRHITVDSLIEWYTNTFNMRRFSQRLDGDDGFDFEWLETPETVRQRWEPLAKLISQIPCLRSFTFGGGDQMPLVLIQALEKYQPRAHLHIRDWARVKDDEDHNNPAELALAVSPLLRSIQAKIWNLREDAKYDLRGAALKRIVALSPHLEHVDIFSGSFGCSIHFSSDYIGEYQRKQLFDVEPSPNTIKSFKSRGDECWHEARDGILGSAIDVSKLECLDVDHLYSGDEEWLRKYETTEPRLVVSDKMKQLSLEINSNDKEILHKIEDFIASCYYLEKLELTGNVRSIPLSNVLMHHGEDLKILAIHEKESPTVEDQPGCTVAELDEIRHSCPNLEDITIDTGKLSSAESLHDVLSALSRFPKLSVIRLYIPLGIAKTAAYTMHMFLDEEEQDIEKKQHQDNPYSPLEDPHWLEYFWLVLKNQKTRYGTPQLRELHVKVGEWEREISGGGYPAAWILWESSNRKYFIAKPVERDDKPDEIYVCERTSGQLNSKDIGEKTVKIPKMVGEHGSNPMSKLKKYARRLEDEIF